MNISTYRLLDHNEGDTSTKIIFYNGIGEAYSRKINIPYDEYQKIDHEKMNDIISQLIVGTQKKYDAGLIRFVDKSLIGISTQYAS